MVHLQFITAHVILDFISIYHLYFYITKINNKYNLLLEQYNALHITYELLITEPINAKNIVNTEIEPINNAKNIVNTEIEPINNAKNNVNTEIEPINNAKNIVNTEIEPINNAKNNVNTEIEPINNAKISFTHNHDYDNDTDNKCYVDNNVPTDAIKNKGFKNMCVTFFSKWI
jgi:hypothetical protein